MLNNFVEKVEGFMIKPTAEKKEEIDNLLKKIIGDSKFSEAEKNSVKTVYSYVEWVATA